MSSFHGDAALRSATDVRQYAQNWRLGRPPAEFDEISPETIANVTDALAVLAEAVERLEAHIGLTDGVMQTHD